MAKFDPWTSKIAEYWNFMLKNIVQQTVPCESTAQKVSFEW